MELEPVTRTQVAVAAKAQAGEEPTEADMNQQALLEHAQRAEGYLEKVRFPSQPLFPNNDHRSVIADHERGWNGIVTSC